MVLVLMSVNIFSCPVYVVKQEKQRYLQELQTKEEKLQKEQQARDAMASKIKVSTKTFIFFIVF